jgi:natural product precursor
MKKLNKLQINSEKLMKNEELIALRGGYGTNCCACYDSIHYGLVGHIPNSSQINCNTDCVSYYGWDITGAWEC